MNGQKDDDDSGGVWDCIILNFFPVIWASLCAWVLFENRHDVIGFPLNLVFAGVLSFIYAVILTALFAGVVYFFKSVVEIFVEIFSTKKLEKKLEEERKKKLEEERKKKLANRSSAKAKKAKTETITTCVFLHKFVNDDNSVLQVLTVSIKETLCFVASCDTELKFNKVDGETFYASQCIDCEVTVIGSTKKGRPVVALINAKNHEKLEEERKKKLEEADRMRLQQETEFLYYLFSILAKMSNADGRVRAEEVNVIEKVFTQFEIAQRRREYCANIFNIAKDKENSVYWYAEKFSSQVATPEICYFLYELLWDVACADGRLHPAEKEILQNICDCLNIPREYYNIIYRRRRATFIECDKEEAKRKSQSEEKKMRDWNRTYVSGRSSILEAYEILESESTATVEELKSAYRRIAKRYHPDLLRANGVPEEMIIKATKYMAQVNVAWKDIRKLRGF